ncbi:DUF58 domain-containing protein [Citricoccus sp. GCM10030269]|uniref:DUF58 domain-containing protein n=1 Tax=Citricoccus sp. GCM10030269 TaxID=3273388 RepID=UPI00360CEE1E
MALLTQNRLRPTPRGIGLGAAAVVLVIAGLLLGRREAIALGLFLAAVAVASGAALAVRLFLARGTRLERQVSPSAVVTGGAVQVDFTTVVPGLRDALPGREPISVGPAGYQWAAARRGVYDVGPALARMIGPFGLWSGRAEVAGTSRIEVFPEPLSDDDLDRVLRAGTSERDAADLLDSITFATGSPDDLLVREHREGEAITRVHWGATARTGQLMVRQEEWAHEPCAVVVLDIRAVSFSAGRFRVDGGGGRNWTTSPGFERAVQTAAAMIERLHGAGHRVLLMDQDGHSLDTALASPVLGSSQREAAWPQSLPADATAVIALLGSAVERDLPVLDSVPHGLQRIAVLFGAGLAGAGLAGGDSQPGSSEGTGAVGEAARRLEADGWLVARAGS